LTPTADRNKKKSKTTTDYRETATGSETHMKVQGVGINNGVGAGQDTPLIQTQNFLNTYYNAEGVYDPKIITKAALTKYFNGDNYVTIDDSSKLLALSTSISPYTKNNTPEHIKTIILDIIKDNIKAKASAKAAKTAETAKEYKFKKAQETAKKWYPGAGSVGNGRFLPGPRTSPPYPNTDDEYDQFMKDSVLTGWVY